jgi:hypothetical protein
MRKTTAAEAPRRCQTDGRYGVSRTLIVTVAPARRRMAVI